MAGPRGDKAGARKITPRAVDGFKEKALSRRRHQQGQLIKLKHGWALRCYEDYRDADGVRQRRRVQKMLGTFEQLPTKRSAQNAMAEELALVNTFTAQPRTTLTFREAAHRWIADREKRKRIKPSVIGGWKSILRNHVLPLIGETPLSDVRNRTMRTLVERLVEKKLSASTIRNVTNVVKLTIASATDEDGNQLFPMKWNRRSVTLTDRPSE